MKSPIPKPPAEKKLTVKKGTSKNLKAGKRATKDLPDATASEWGTKPPVGSGG